MDFDPTPLFGAGILLGLVGLVISLAAIAGAVWLSLWITYTIIWRAVRRGMREFHGLGPVSSSRPVAPPPIS